MLNYVRKEWTDQEFKRYLEKGRWSRTMFWNWILVCKNTGARPEELMKLRWKEVEYVDIGRFSKSAQKERIQELMSKNILIDEGRLDELGPVSNEIAHVVLRSSKTGQIRISSCDCVYVFEHWLKFQVERIKKQGLSVEITPNDYVRGRPHEVMTCLSYSSYKSFWQARDKK